ncbi:ion transporter [Raoultibacter massiliensis]|uniref:ion transporter n=1 Tax=Raoultibacter massiliensis TaxID=1852371 RepID=UPI003A90C2DB
MGKPRMAEDRMSRASALKRRAYFAVNDPLHGGLLARIFGAFVFALIIANAVLVFAEAQAGFPAWVYSAFWVFGVVSTACFGIEYAVRLWVSDLAHPALSAARARVRYATSVMGIIDLLAFLPGMIAWFVPMTAQMFSGIRVIRLVRLIKISRYMKGVRSIGRVLAKRRHEIVAAFMVLALLTVTASVLMFQVENPVQPEKFDSVFTGMYWAMTTITSTGYGDLVPVTALGRFIGFCTMVLSIAVVAIPAGIFSAGFVAQFKEEDAESAKQANAAGGASADDGSLSGDATVSGGLDEGDPISDRRPDRP